MDRTELARSLLTRFKGLEETRQPWVGSWQELTEYMLPRKNSFTAPGPGMTMRGRTGDERIFDSTPMHALELLASSLGGLLTNSALPWFDISVKDRRLGDATAVRDFLQAARERMVAVFNSEDTGFQAHVHELYLDVALLGTAVMYVESDNQTVVRFTTRPLGEVYVAESVRGQVDTVYRKYEIPARQAALEWGGACSDEIRRMAEDRPEEKVEILHAVFPRTDRDPRGLGVINFPYASVYLEIRNSHIVEESGYLEMPYMVPRWAKAAGEIYGRGPGQTALSDTRVLNAMARTALMAAEKMSDPPLMVPDDGFLGPVRSGPGGLSYYRAGSSDRIEPLPVNVDLRATEDMMTQRRESIRRIFLGDQLSQEGPAVTATEAVIRQSEKMRVLGPVLGRLQTEFLSPLIKRVFRIMLRMGELPTFPEGLNPEDLEVRYTSPVARAQKQYEAQGLAQVMEYLSPLVGAQDAFGIMDNFDTDRMARHVAELFHIPSDYLKAEDMVSESRDQRQQAAGSAQTASTVANMAAIAKTLSEAYTDRPNVLTELWAMLSGTLAGAALDTLEPSSQETIKPEQSDREEPHA
ncbi:MULTISPECIES: portal protein [unclassified Pseudodesulfovibrio]|uniref:portal protein n=1 Tax=unclassified Pseudodesulfovibrio TaxID=2661612 RepID=UPI000FEC1F51|nr:MULTISPECIES: portal protein [unclassified Pseudodesulfovibrio]MCJ2165608.1 portal protein [Pseudodesulfovibrio sp. S3-i]RWU03016.1 head-tail adaptor [Pseudodesulfovibrio sp. S3]